MNDTELIALWKNYDAKLSESLSLNRKNAEDITRLKVGTLLSSMKPVKITLVIIGIIWVIAVDFVVLNSLQVASVYFLVSMSLQSIITKLAIGIYIWQLVIINRISSDEPIIETQHKLAKLKTLTLNVTRLLFLQSPLWTTFFLSNEMLKNSSAVELTIQIASTLVFTFAAVWLFFNIRFENRNKKWFRVLFKGKEWTPLMKAMDLLEQTNDYQKP
ncbi:MAG: hypothetical protein ACRC3B_21200 [Bacteroidia bacterium]